MKTKSKSLILIVDDDPGTRMILSRVLVKEGYDVAQQTNGAECLLFCETQLPDVIVLDAMMPEMDGFETLRHLRQRPDLQATPVIMLTALQELQDKVKGLESGADDFLRKPVDRTELLIRVRTQLRAKQLLDELERRNAILQNIVRRYVADEITQGIFSNPEAALQLGGDTAQISVLFVNIWGFHRITEKHDARTTTDHLNLILGHLAPIIRQYDGIFDKYIDEGLMAFYGAPIAHEDDPLRAVQTAIDMQLIFREIQRQHPSLAELGLRAGIQTGSAVVGNLGSQDMMDFTAIGDTVNTAKRLQETATQHQILICKKTAESVCNQLDIRELEPLLLKGKTEPQTAFEVVY